MRDRHGLAHGVISLKGTRSFLKPGKKEEYNTYLDKIKPDYDAMLPEGVTLLDISGLKRVDGKAPRMPLMRRDNEFDE